MTEQEKMWTGLEAHQPTADKLGYGVAWTRMCRLKTEEAFSAAWEAAWAAADAALLVYEEASKSADAADSVMQYIQKANKRKGVYD